jgi:hypothetical protein
VTFSLYSKEQSILPFDDYGAIVNECQRLGSRAAVEFGPGFTTLALFEGGCEAVYSYEYDPSWATKIFERVEPLVPYGRTWMIGMFVNEPEIRLALQNFDIALVDSPVGGNSTRRVTHAGQEGLSRFNTLKWALYAAPVVLLHDAERPDEQASIEALGAKHEMLSRKVARVWR